MIISASAETHSHVDEHISLIQTNSAVQHITIEKSAGSYHPHHHDERNYEGLSLNGTELLPQHDNVLVIFTISILALLGLGFCWITDSLPKPKHGMFQHLPDYETL
jgi:hypothetical protein